MQFQCTSKKLPKKILQTLVAYQFSNICCWIIQSVSTCEQSKQGGNKFHQIKNTFIIYRQRPIFLLLAKNFFQPTNANMATFHHSEKACPHFCNSLLQSDKIGKFSFYLYFQNIQESKCSCAIWVYSLCRIKHKKERNNTKGDYQERKSCKDNNT